MFFEKFNEISIKIIKEKVDRDQGRWISDKIFDFMDILYHAVHSFNRDFELVMFFKEVKKLKVD